MCHAETNPALLSLVAEAVDARMQRREPFTALDVSNALKARRLPLRHRQVAAIVRDIHDSGAMCAFGYERDVIAVRPDGGGWWVPAFLYRPVEQDAFRYTAREQRALPPVAADDARPLDDSVPAGDHRSPFRNG